MTELAADVRPGRRRGRDDRRHQLLPRVRVRPAGRERADHGLDLRRGDRRAQGRAGCSGSSCCRARWCSSRRRSSRPPRAPSGTSPPPISTYGFQKLASEYFAHGAWEQYQLPYTILRPFNCVGHRRAAGGPRHGHHERQREARHVARRARPRAQGAQGPGPAAHPGRRVAGPALHVRRRPGARDPARDGVGRGGQRRLQPLDGGVDDRARAGRGDLDEGPRRRTSRSATSPTRRSSTTSSCASPTSGRPARCWASRRRRRSTTMLDEVIPWIRAELEAGRL